MFPIVLAHGIARFDVLRELIKDELDLPENPLDDEIHYFRNIRSHLRNNGFQDVFATNVDFAGSVDLRAAQLRDRVNDVVTQTGSEKVHIIAHSMGGLDARRMIVDLGMAGRVSSLTTIGTPHLGTVVADHIVAKGDGLLLDAIRKAVHLDVDGVADLTTDACLTFNARAIESEAKNGVAYQVYSSFESINDLFIPLLASWALIHHHDGRNDGLVSVRSQMWADRVVASDGTTNPISQNEFPIEADHLNEVGWWDLAEAVNPLFGGSLHKQKANYEMQIKSVYLDIARGLANIL